MTNLRRIYPLPRSLRCGIDAIAWSERHAFPIPPERVELTAPIGSEPAEILGGIAERMAQ